MLPAALQRPKLIGGKRDGRAYARFIQQAKDPTLTGEKVYEGGKERSHFPQGVNAGKHLPREGLEFLMPHLGTEDDIRTIHSVRAGRLAPTTLGAVLDPVIDDLFSIEPKPLGIGAGLLGAGKEGIHGKNRAVFHTDGTPYTVLEHA